MTEKKLLLYRALVNSETGLNGTYTSLLRLLFYTLRCLYSFTPDLPGRLIPRISNLMLVALENVYIIFSHVWMCIPNHATFDYSANFESIEYEKHNYNRR